MEIHNKQKEQYLKYKHSVDNIQNAIRREIPHLTNEFDLNLQEVKMLNEFINDKMTMFRFLRKNQYSLPTTLSFILDTIRWRMIEQIDYVRISSIDKVFLNNPFVYFHQFDEFNRPIMIIQLAHLPKTPEGQDTTEFLTPFVIFVLETARSLIADRLKEDRIVMDVNVLIDFKNSNSLPMDINLLKSFVTLLRKYPGIIGTVQFINFGWMYQGIWQMIKLVLSNEAKQKVNFPSLNDLKYLIKPENLLLDYGGLDRFEWCFEEDVYYKKYRKDILAPVLSRCSSSSSVYYDSLDLGFNMSSRPPSSLSVYNTPVNSLSPVSSYTNLTQVAKVYSNYTLQTSMPLRSTIKQLGDIFQSQQEQPSLEILPPAEPHINPRFINSDPPRRGWFVKLMLKFEMNVRLMLVNSLKKARKYKNTVYWIIAGILLRDGFQELCQQLVLKMMEIAFIGNQATGNKLIMRSMLGLTTGQMTL